MPLNTQLDGYVHYSAGYAQDDWRVNDKLTHQLRPPPRARDRPDGDATTSATVNFDQTAVSPLNSQVNVIDPVTGAAPPDPGRPDLRRRQRRADRAGQPAGDQGRAARRRGLQLQRRRPCCAAAGASTTRRGTIPAAGTNGWGQIGYSATTQRAAVDRRRADVDDEQSVPERPRAAERQHARPADRRRRRHPLRRSEQGRAARAAVLGRPAARAAAAA